MSAGLAVTVVAASRRPPAACSAGPVPRTCFDESPACPRCGSQEVGLGPPALPTQGAPPFARGPQGHRCGQPLPASVQAAASGPEPHLTWLPRVLPSRSLSRWTPGLRVSWGPRLSPPRPTPRLSRAGPVLPAAAQGRPARPPRALAAPTERRTPLTRARSLRPALPDAAGRRVPCFPPPPRHRRRCRGARRPPLQPRSPSPESRCGAVLLTGCRSHVWAPRSARQLSPRRPVASARPAGPSPPAWARQGPRRPAELGPAASGPAWVSSADGRPRGRPFSASGPASHARVAHFTSTHRQGRGQRQGCPRGAWPLSSPRG